MDLNKIGPQIRMLRHKQGLTQKQLAQRLNITEQAVSKWERSLGCPDLSLLPSLAQQLQVPIEGLLTESQPAAPKTGGSMHTLNFYVCPTCGNRITGMKQASLCCCGAPLTPMAPQKPDEAHALTLEAVEDEWFITTHHPMTKEHYISFAALVKGDQVLLAERWPEWDFQLRIPNRGHGFLYWYCTRHGLFRQKI